MKLGVMVFAGVLSSVSFAHASDKMPCMQVKKEAERLMSYHFEHNESAYEAIKKGEMDKVEGLSGLADYELQQASNYANIYSTFCKD